jgi:hypothetical protein
MRPPERYAVDMKLCRLISFAALILLAGCARRPAPDQLFSPTQLSNLVTDRTLYVPYRPHGMFLFSSDKSNGMLLYLARDGTGWLDSRLVSGSPPEPSSMSMVFNWRVIEGSQVCLWASPLIGDMPSFTPAFHVCVQVLRSGMPLDELEAKITQDGKSRLGPLELYASNEFSPLVIDQYLTRVRVLYGGQIPDWTLR